MRARPARRGRSSSSRSTTGASILRPGDRPCAQRRGACDCLRLKAAGPRHSTGSRRAVRSCSSSAADRGGDRGARERAGPGRRPRRPRRLRTRDVQRLLQADPRRAALPPDGRCPPRPRGPRRGRTAHRVRRPAPRSPPPLSPAGLRRRPVRTDCGPGAVGLYRLLSGSRVANAFVPGDIAASLVPSLRLDGLREVGVYSDAQTNDARLCLANVRAAADAGAAVANYVEVVLDRQRPGVDEGGGRRPDPACVASSRRGPSSTPPARGSTRSDGWPTHRPEPP